MNLQIRLKTQAARHPPSAVRLSERSDLLCLYFSKLFRNPFRQVAGVRQSHFAQAPSTGLLPGGEARRHSPRAFFLNAI
jgi:hypothetical protein